VQNHITVMVLCRFGHGLLLCMLGCAAIWCCNLSQLHVVTYLLTVIQDVCNTSVPLTVFVCRSAGQSWFDWHVCAAGMPLPARLREAPCNHQIQMNLHIASNIACGV
jgi:hypothetical protein